jgi:ribosomal protein S18 acetylase RimI-like enzyme
MPGELIRGSQLSAHEIAFVRDFLNGRQPFSLYFATALNDLQRGLDNRHFWLGKDGFLIGIEFDGNAILSSVGALPEELVAAVVQQPKKMEMHFSRELAAVAAGAAGERLRSEENLLYFGLEREAPFELQDPSLRRLGPADLAEAQRFYRTHYPDTIFSAWMLELPFVGYFEDERLLAAAGAIVMDRNSGAANIGNFLTADAARGQGLGGKVLRFLLNELQKEGFRDFSLGTTAENEAACQLYDKAGFAVLDRRKQIKIAAASSQT